MGVVINDNFACFAATMSAVLDRLRRAIDREDNKYEGLHACELCHGLANLAADSINLKNAVSHLAQVKMLLTFCLQRAPSIGEKSS